MKNAEHMLWLFNFRFVIKAFIGTILTLLAVFLSTSRAIIRPLYLSETIVYVPLSILSQQLNQQGIGFGDDKEIDLYIQILKSSIMSDSLNKRFGLMQKFDLDSNSLRDQSRLNKILKSRIDIEKTRYGSVSVKVLDRSPQLAADMANTIITIGEKIKWNIFNPNRTEAMKYAKDLYQQKASDLAHLQKSLDSSNKKDLQYESILKLYNLELPELIARKTMYERKKKELDTPLPGAYIISSAIPASDPAKPERRILMIFGAGIYLLLLIAIEIIKHEIDTPGKNS